MSKNLSTSFASSIIVNTYEQLLRSQRSRSLSKTKSSNIFTKVKSVNSFRPGKITPEVPKPAPKKQTNLKSKTIIKPEIRSLNESTMPISYSFISSKSKIFSDLFTVLKKSKNLDSSPNIKPTFEKPSQSLNQSLEFSIELHKPASENNFNINTEDAESMKYGSYPSLIELYESEKEARKHFESLNEKSNKEKETLIKQLETLIKNFEQFSSQDSDESLRLELRALKQQSENEREKVLNEVEKLQNRLKDAQIRESHLLDQLKNCEHLSKIKEQSQLHLQKLQNELNLYKSAELLQSQPYELKITPRSHCESCEQQINTLRQSLLSIKSENEDLVLRLTQQKSKQSIPRSLSENQIPKNLHLMEKSELVEEFTKIKSENSELFKRLLNQADETFEKNKE